MAFVLLGLGSNQNPRAQLQAAVSALRVQFGELRLSPTYESQSLGFAGANFWNLVVGISTPLALPALATQLRLIEEQLGRDRQIASRDRVIDIDILTYNHQVGSLQAEYPGQAGAPHLRQDIILPRPEILTSAFVLKPLADTWPHWQHPLRNQSYRELWQAYDAGQHPLIEVML